ncbi:hypothetical protein APHCRT_0392 [Anaplasma phagocytophilum str. CRT53-1]|uniref:Uncharacterized protein n=1 Tax=Anaplasma phagocytophilum str. CRT53-1 TaxID=1359157 RepID=A0A0F3Q601_ANAPH|nr:hypothetical protein APHCRT_0392 [Anaplasma phagocytophilum str. CRT53-1]
MEFAAMCFFGAEDMRLLIQVTRDVCAMICVFGFEIMF